jgi:uncharacterized membrane protein
MRMRLPPWSQTVLYAVLLAAALATAVGMALLAPAHRSFGLTTADASGGGPVHTVPAHIESVFTGNCGFNAQGLPITNPPPGQGEACVLATVKITGGKAAGLLTQLQLTPGPGTPPLHAGEAVRVEATHATDGPAYVFADFDRHRSLLVLGIVAALVLVGVARLRGLAALVGLGAGVAMVVLFLIPGILAGEPALPLTLTGSAALLIVLLYLVHGPSTRTSCALAGTLLGLGITGVAAYAGVHIASLYGQNDEDLVTVQTYSHQLDIRSLIIAGFVIGALGALNDLTVTQASTVWELRAANPALGGRVVYRAAMRVGRDHIASAVYTLVFAYVGTALPSLLLFSLADQRVLDVITSDTVAIELLAAMVGVVGLVAVVPVTTALAAYISGQLPARSLLASGHGHVHAVIPHPGNGTDQVKAPDPAGTPPAASPAAPTRPRPRPRPDPKPGDRRRG